LGDFAGYLKAHLPDVTYGKMNLNQFRGGHANLTYLISFGNNELILRRLPFDKIASWRT